MRDNSRFYIPVLSTLILMGVVLTVQALSKLPDNWREFVCKPEDCTLQEWMSATSGWAGFLAAAMGAYYIYHQLAEQRKQTAFLLGDGEPTIELVRASGRSTSGLIRVVNWNRRSLVIDSIKIESGHALPAAAFFLLQPKEEETDVDRVEIQPCGSIPDRPRVEGWRNRQEGPDEIEFCLEFNAPLAAELHARTKVIPIAIKLSVFHPEVGHVIRSELVVETVLGGLYPKPTASFE